MQRFGIALRSEVTTVSVNFPTRMKRTEDGTDILHCNCDRKLCYSSFHGCPVLFKCTVVSSLRGTKTNFLCSAMGARIAVNQHIRSSTLKRRKAISVAAAVRCTDKIGLAYSRRLDHCSADNSRIHPSCCPAVKRERGYL
jgi:hypothetical protein